MGVCCCTYRATGVRIMFESTKEINPDSRTTPPSGCGPVHLSSILLETIDPWLKPPMKILRVSLSANLSASYLMRSWNMSTVSRSSVWLKYFLILLKSDTDCGNPDNSNQEWVYLPCHIGFHETGACARIILEDGRAPCPDVKNLKWDVASPP